MKKTIICLVGLAFVISSCSNRKTNKESIQTVKVDTVQAYGEKNRTTFS
jgi:PBP1b-binding outer membrane lipoprotein LpoB